MQAIASWRAGDEERVVVDGGLGRGGFMFRGAGGVPVAARQHQATPELLGVLHRARRGHFVCVGLRSVERLAERAHRRRDQRGE